MGAGHHLAIHHEALERLLARQFFRLIAHARPHIGSDEVRALAGLPRIVELAQVRDLRRAQGVARAVLLDAIAFRPGEVQGETEHFRGLQPGVEHIVGVADPGHGLALDRAAMLDIGHDIGEDLAGMKLVGQAVDHRHARIRGETLDDFLTIGANHHQIDHARKHLRRIFDGLATAQLAIAGIDVDGRAAELVHAGLEAQPGAGGVLLENHRQGAIDQGLVRLVAFELGLDQRGAGENVVVLLTVQVGKLQIVPQRGFHHSLLGCLLCVLFRGRVLQKIKHRGNQRLHQRVSLLLGEDQRWQQADNPLLRDVEQHPALQHPPHQRTGRPVELDADHQALTAHLHHASMAGKRMTQRMLNLLTARLRVGQKAIVFDHGEGFQRGTAG